jgi:hypothetical protein
MSSSRYVDLVSEGNRPEKKRAELKALLRRQHEALKFRKLHQSTAQMENSAPVPEAPRNDYANN